MHHPESAVVCPEPSHGSIVFHSETTGAVDVPMCRSCAALAVAATAVYEALAQAAEASLAPV